MANTEKQYDTQKCLRAIINFFLVLQLCTAHKSGSSFEFKSPYTSLNVLVPSPVNRFSLSFVFKRKKKKNIMYRDDYPSGDLNEMDLNYF